MGRRFFVVCCCGGTMMRSAGLVIVSISSRRVVPFTCLRGLLPSQARHSGSYPSCVTVERDTPGTQISFPAAAPEPAAPAQRSSCVRYRKRPGFDLSHGRASGVGRIECDPLLAI